MRLRQQESFEASTDLHSSSDGGDHAGSGNDLSDIEETIKRDFR